jgi:hypothetical protein
MANPLPGYARKAFEVLSVIWPIVDRSQGTTVESAGSVKRARDVKAGKGLSANAKGVCPAPARFIRKASELTKLVSVNKQRLSLE